AFFPGGGLMYLGKVFRGLFYTATVFGVPFIFIAGALVTNVQFFLIFAFGGLLLYIVNFIDTAVTASKLYNQTETGETVERNPDSERFFTIILSFIPGMG